MKLFEIIIKFLGRVVFRFGGTFGEEDEQDGSEY